MRMKHIAGLLFFVWAMYITYTVSVPVQAAIPLATFGDCSTTKTIVNGGTGTWFNSINTANGYTEPGCGPGGSWCAYNYVHNSWVACPDGQVMVSVQFFQVNPSSRGTGGGGSTALNIGCCKLFR